MLVSVIIPTFNRLGMILRALDSVRNQSYQNLELIVVDDGSTDATRDFIRRYDDNRIRYFFTEHKGVAHARNFGVRRARADWICFLDSDDVWRRHKLSEQVRHHNADRSLLISQTDDVWIRNSVRVNKMKKHAVRSGWIFRESLKLCLICCSSVMMRKDLFLNTGGFDESLATCEDYDLWLRITARYSVGFVDKLLVTKFGGHADQLSKAYPMMDLYRVRALNKLLATGIPDKDQKKWIMDEINNKTKIIATGREKRKDILCISS